jgi:hypothetical protein
VCFLGYALWKTLQQWQSRAGLGDSPRTILTELSRITAADIVLLTARHASCAFVVSCAPTAARRSSSSGSSSPFPSACAHRIRSKCSGDSEPQVLDFPRITPSNCGSWVSGVLDVEHRHRHQRGSAPADSRRCWRLPSPCFSVPTQSGELPSRRIGGRARPSSSNTTRNTRTR